MPKFGSKSKKKLATCHPELQRLCNEVIKYYDFSVLEGHRTKAKQDNAFKQGRSKVQYPNSKHNTNPSMAVDIAPYPINWKDTPRWYHFGGYVKATADRLEIPIRWGGDWDGDFDLKDQNFYDLPHFELIEAKLKPKQEPKEEPKHLPIMEQEDGANFWQLLMTLFKRSK